MTGRAGWQGTKVKYLADCLDYARIPLNASERADRPGSVPYWGSNSIQGYVDEPLFDEELVLLGEDGAPFFDPDRPVAFAVDGPIWPNNHIHVLRPHPGVSQRWLTYALNVVNYAQWINGSTRDKLTQEAMGSIEIPTPSPLEQRAIADFLDRETAQIDAIIAKQEELIGLLGERRSALIAHAVTRGLDPHAPMKPARLDGVPQVPEHWVTGNIRRFAEMRTGHTPSRSVSEYWEHCDIPWFTLADVWQLREGRTHITETKERISKLGLENSAADLLPVGTVLLSRTASVGFVGIASVEMATSQDFWNWVCGPRLWPEYLLYYLRAIAPGLRGISRGSTHRTIYKPVAASIQLPVPPLDEQQAIADFIGEQCGRLDSLVLKAEESISLMRERRAALISDAVTGRLDIESYGRGRTEEGVA